LHVLALFTAAIVVTAFFAGCDGPVSQMEGNETVVIEKTLDGDSIIADDGTRIQIIGVNAPETKNPGGEEAARYTRELLLGKEVVLESDSVDTDEYGRSLRHVWVDGDLASARIIGSGYAVFKAFPPGPVFDKHVYELEAAERSAVETGSGLWPAGYLQSQIY
jgi:micrococcal nuclease